MRGGTPSHRTRRSEVTLRRWPRWRPLPLDKLPRGGILGFGSVPAPREAWVATKKQWHPVFAELLRPLVESHYEVEANMPVGDAPRQADFVLLRRTRAGRLPSAGLWRDL